MRRMNIALRYANRLANPCEHNNFVVLHTKIDMLHLANRDRTSVI